MFRPQICRASSRPSVNYRIRPLVQHSARRYNSSDSLPARKAQRRTYISVLIGGGAVVAAYLFWPSPSRSAPTRANALLSPAHFTPVTVVSSEACVDPDTRIITLAVPPESLPSLQDSSFSPIWSIYIKDDDIQVERAYTPLEGIDEGGRMKFWIKKYLRGEVGRWLHSKRPGDTIEIRGPLKTWPWKDDNWDEIVMISGGTGITPFYQLLHHAILSESHTPSKTRYTLIHSSRTPSTLPPPAILEPLLSAARRDADRFKLVLHVDSQDGSSHPSVAPLDLQIGRVGRPTIERALGINQNNGGWWQSLLGFGAKEKDRTDDRKILFLVCGPDPMVGAISGPFGRNLSQGAVGGILGEMGYKSENVWKL